MKRNWERCVSEYLKFPLSFPFDPPQLHTTHSFVRDVMWSALFSNARLAEDFKSCLGHRLCLLKGSEQFSQRSDWATGWTVLGSNFFRGKKFYLTQFFHTGSVAHPPPYLNTGVLQRAVKRLESDDDQCQGYEKRTAVIPPPSHMPFLAWRRTKVLSFILLRPST